MIATVAAIIIKKNKILLLKRNHRPFRNHWVFPGGHIENGETAEKAVTREVKEETGLSFKGKFYCHDNEIFKKFDWYSIVLLFKGTTKGDLKFPKREVKELRLFSFKEAKKLRIGFNHRKILTKIINDERRKNK